MNKLLFPLMIALLSFCCSPFIHAQNKGEIKCNYVIKNLKLNKVQAAKFKPLFINYVNELKAAKSTYDNLKDKYKPAIKSGRLSQGQAIQLLNAHWNSDTKETAVKRKYSNIFISCIGAQKTYQAFDYASDSMKKMKGSKGKSSKDDDDEE